jgi:predicted Zn-dependent protease with MMP-like domain
MNDGMPRAQERAPTIGDIEALAASAYDTIPKAMRDRIQDLIILVHDFPDEDIIDDMELETPFDLLGLYSGVDLTAKSMDDAPQEMDMIFLYRRAILDYWAEIDIALGDLVRHVLIHEIGHHFGFSDADMEAIEEAS